MTEPLLFSIAQGVLGKIASPALQEAVAIYCVEDQIHELKKTLTAITAVLLDAEEQAKNHHLQLWLRWLRDVLYDAEDVLDELECEVLRKRVISRYGGIKKKVHRFFSISNPLILRAKISHKIKEIRETLSKISIEKNRFDLNERSVDNGLISSTTENLVGVDYIKVLWKRSLIQEVKEFESILIFKMHDLVHSLATIVAQDDCSIVGLDIVEISEGVRYISFSSDSLEEISNFDGVPPFMRKPTSKRLHAITFQFNVDYGIITKEFARTCISKCHHLRYLDLRFGSFEELPSSICNLKLLRLLFLGYNKQLKKLPDSICELRNLLYLYLNGCSALGDLPKKMKRLISLRQLYVTTKQMSLQESGIQYLENLQLLGLTGCQNLKVSLKALAD
ncbi:hypothetical protein ACJRO7_021667 [Eucalyptus globulus]|uniref:Rx N-terminal domain-containing protein n=1 Tax=Eucalyptus globulus TaxID=34317 RepID=A0ABD3KKM1_EUCGL